MYKIGLFLSLCGLFILGSQTVQAHSHHHHHTNTYIVEQAPPTVVVVQQAPAQPVNVITVESQPPADLFEQMDPSPGDDYVWQKGHWQWNGSWVWTKGVWGRRPHEGGVYVPGYWRQSHHHHRWEYVEPHWK